MYGLSGISFGPAEEAAVAGRIRMDMTSMPRNPALPGHRCTPAPPPLSCPPVGIPAIILRHGGRYITGHTHHVNGGAYMP